MKVEIVYFKSSGKYYSTGEYETDCPGFRVHLEVIEMFRRGECPGLHDDSARRNQFYATVTAEDGVPRLVFPSDL